MIEPRNVVAILLAAGQSVRFGDSDKLLEPLEGRSLVLHAAVRMGELAFGRKIAVCGSQAVADLVHPLGFQIVLNPEPGRGLSDSLSLGISAASAGRGDAVLIALGDMPFVTVAHFGRLMTRFDATSEPMVASEAGGAPMPPAIFARSLFNNLQSAQGDAGARGLLAKATTVYAAAGELADIDTRDDLGRLRRPVAIDPDACPEL